MAHLVRASGRRRALGLWVLGLVVLLGGLGDGPEVRAGVVDPALTSVTRPTADVLVVTLSVAAYTQDDGTSASGALTSADFAITPAVAIDTVTGTAGGTTFTLDLAAAPASGATVDVAGGQVFTAAGEPFASTPRAVPLVDSALTALLAGLQAVEVPLTEETDLDGEVEEVVNLPLVGDWFANEVDGTRAARPIDDLVAGIAALPAATASSQAGFEAALETIDGVEAAFDGSGLTLTFDGATTTATHPMTGRLVAEAAGIAVDGSPTVDLTLDGALRLVVVDGAAHVDAAGSQFDIGLDASAPMAVTAQVGFVELTGADASLEYGTTAIGVDLGCVAPATTCVPSAMTAVADVSAGVATFTVGALAVEDGSTTTVGTFGPVAPATDVLSITYADLTDLSVAPTVDLAALGDVANFTNTSLDRAVASLQFVAASLATAEQFGALATDLPVAGGQLGDMARAGQALAERVAAVADAIGAADPADAVSAQDLVGLLCDAGLVDLAAADCATALTPLAITGSEITFAIDLDVARQGGDGAEEVALPTTLGIDVGEVLDGFSLSEITGGAGLTLAVDAEVGLTVGLDIRPDAELLAQFGLSVEDFDGDGTPNADDANADGDSTPDATDPDLDADGVPEAHRFQPGDLCTRAAALVGASADDVVAANGLDVAPAPWVGEYTSAHAYARCDTLVIGAAGFDAPGVTDRVLTDAEACYAAATLFLVPVAAADPVPGVNQRFQSLNSYADDAACATAVRAGTGPFAYDEDGIAFGSPVTIAHRAYVETSTEPALAIDVDLAGTVTMEGRLGFLDVALSGDVAVAPRVEVHLADPATGSADDRVTFGEIAAAIDASPDDDLALGDVTDIEVTGAIDVHMAVQNATVIPAALHIDVVGELSAIDNDPAEVFELHGTSLADATGLTADRIHVGTDLGDLLAFEDVVGTEVHQLLRRFADRMVELAASSELALDIPFVGSGIQEVLGFADTWGTVVDQVLAADPETISALDASMNAALVANGFPTELTVGIDAGAFTIGFDGSTSIERTFPFSLDALTADLPFPIAPADGGASLSVEAGVDFHPVLGIDLDAETVDEALFIASPDLTLTVDIDGEVFGAVHLGPMSTGIEGTVAVHGEAVVDVETFGDDRLTVAEALEATDGDGTDDAPLFAATIGGDFSATLTTTSPDGTITIDGEGDLADPTAAVIVTDIDLSTIRLDLDAMLEGVIESTRYLGRVIARSSDLNLELPLIGDGLGGAAQLGNQLEALADDMDELKAMSIDDPEGFLASLEDEINGALGCPACVVLAVVDEAGLPVESLLDAHEITLAFELGWDSGVATTLIDEGIGVDGVFEAGLAFEAGLEYGYGAGFTMGFSMDDGFFLDNGPNGSLLSLYAGLSAADIDAAVDIMGVPLATVEGGTAAISGALGPRGTAAGFRVQLADRLTLNDIVDRTSDVDELSDVGFDVQVDIDLPLRTTSELGSVPLPTLEVPVHFDWSIDGFSPSAPSLTLGTEEDPIALDGSTLLGQCAGTACTGLIAPVWQTIGQYNPLAQEPLSTILTSDIPVVEQSILDLAVSLNVPYADLLQFLASLDGTVPSIEIADARIEFGWVEVLPAFEFHRDPRPWQCQAATVVAGLEELFASVLPAADCSGDAVAGTGAGTRPPTSPVTPPRPGTRPSARVPGAPLFQRGPLSVDIPLLGDPTLAMGLLLGPDAADPFPLVEVRFGTGDAPFNIGLGFNFSATLFELDAGFLSGSLKVSLSGGIGLQLRFGIGYDTTGIQPGRSLLDGFYLVDFHNSAGADVPEISAGGFVSGAIDGRFSVVGGLASVRFQGAAGINLTAGIDFFDESVAIPEAERGDGRFHLYEMGMVAGAHQFPGTAEPDYAMLDTVGFELDDILCIFRPEIDFSYFLRFSGSAKVLGVTVFDETYSTSGSIIPGGPLSITCPLGVRIAQVVDGQLVLNGGPEYGLQRFDGLGDIAERFQLQRVGDEIHVSWTGAGSGYGTLRFPVADVPRGVLGDLGDGNDAVDVVGDLGVPVNVVGGPGDDELEGADQGDQLDGGDGDDVVVGAGDDDGLFGGPGNDLVDGGTGDDELAGGDGDDSYAFSDGWGNETLADPFGTDTLDFASATAALGGTSSYGEGRIESDAASLLYVESDVEAIIGSGGADTFEFQPTAPDGLHFDGAGGGDTASVQLSNLPRTLTFRDTGSAADDDTIVPLGTAAADTILLRGQAEPLDAATVEAARAAPAQSGFVALVRGQSVDRIDHDTTVELVHVRGGAGGDTFALDDNASGEHTTIDGESGDDRFQVGQVFGDASTVRGGVAADPASCRATAENIDDQPVGEFPRCTGLRDAAVGVGLPGDEFGLRDTTRGFVSNGITHPATLSGGAGDDVFHVYSNLAPIELNGDDDDDTFILRAFALEGSVSARVIAELGLDAVDVDLGAGVDYVEYAQNANVTIDGGAGDDTVVLVGTEFQDGILIADGAARVCAVADLVAGTLNLDPAAPPDARPCAFSSIQFDNIETLAVQALGGNDLVLALSTGPEVGTRVYGGADDDVLFVGRNPTDATASAAQRGGDLSGIAGSLTISGDSDPTFDETIPTALTLPGEVAGEPEPASPLAIGTQDGDVGIVDASANPTSGDTGAIEEVVDDDVATLRLTGLGTADGGVVLDAIDFLDVRLGAGADAFTVARTHGRAELPADRADAFPAADMDPVAPARIITEAAGETHVAPLQVQGGAGDDAIAVEDVDVATRILAGEGDDVVDLGSPVVGPGVLEQLDAHVEVRGGGATTGDTLRLDDALETAVQTATIDADDVFGLGLHDLGVRYVEVEILDVDLGSNADVVDVRGTSAATTVHGNAGDERYYVTDTADLTATTTTDHLVGDLDDVVGSLTLDSGAGRHLLMVSDDAAGAGDGGAVVTESSITGLAPGAITYTTSPSAGSWAAGVVVWASQHADVITVDGAHRRAGVRTVTTVNAGAGNDVLTVDVAAADHDLAVVNGEEGDDTILGATSSAGFVAFGDLGADAVTTGSGADVVLGDRGRVQYGAGPAFPMVLGGGGPGDRTDGIVRPLISAITSDDAAPGPGADVVHAGDGGDVVLGQQGADELHGDGGDDHLTGGQNTTGAADDADTIDGGPGADRIAGDNARIEPTRDVVLRDVETGSIAASPAVHGGDVLTGGDGDDAVFGQGDDDDLHGGPGSDVIEGGAGSDTAFGGAGSDDVVGGGSAADGVLDGTRDGAGLRDLGDRLFGDDSTSGSSALPSTDGHDVIAGDNAWIRGAGILSPPAGANYTTRRLRTVMLFDLAAGDSSGSDWIRGGGGEDDLYGQFDDGAVGTLGTVAGEPVGCEDGRAIPKVDGDLLCGDAGHDGVVGDRGTITSRTAESMRAAGPEAINTNNPFLRETGYQRGTVIRVVVLDPVATGGADVVFGGAGDDHLHPGAGGDVVNGGEGDDAAFGGPGDDALWGDIGHDRLYGGDGLDSIDLKLLPGAAPRAGEERWRGIAPLVDTDDAGSTSNGSDVIYGGKDPDRQQADEGQAGNRAGDRLVDFQGAYNAFFVCDGAYGAGQVLRQRSPNAEDVLQRLATADGAATVATSQSSGWVELSIVTTSDVRQNTNPTHPDHPANFSCENPAR